MAEERDQEIADALAEFLRLHARLNSFASAHRGTPTHTRETCPLAANHHVLSQIIFGVGSFWWTCGFCGREEEE